MHAWTVVGYTFQAAVYCPQHKPVGAVKMTACLRAECRDSDCCPQPIFYSDEGWREHACDHPHGTCNGTRYLDHEGKPGRCAYGLYVGDIPCQRPGHLVFEPIGDLVD